MHCLLCCGSDHDESQAATLARLHSSSTCRGTDQAQCVVGYDRSKLLFCERDFRTPELAAELARPATTMASL